MRTVPHGESKGGLVLDASALVEYLLRTAAGLRLDPVLAAQASDLHVLALCDVEVASILRTGLLRKALSPSRAGQALQDYLDLPLTRHGHTHLLPRILNLYPTLSAYDATYVALAEGLGATLVTADQRLARAAERLALPSLSG